MSDIIEYNSQDVSWTAEQYKHWSKTMHTTQLDNNWVAFHDSELTNKDLVTLVNQSTNEEVKIPYECIKELVNKQLCNAIISKVEQTDDLIGTIVSLLS